MLPDEPANLIHRLAVGDDGSVAAIVEASRTSDDVATLVACALFAPVATGLLTRAAAFATSTRDRQLVAIARAYLGGEHDQVDALARDHLADHPDSVLVAWVAASNNPNRTRRDQS